jgi:CDP-diacylglycerol--serine O-phosphatidyltransferase
MKHIPNLISCLNLTSGFLAVISTFNGNIDSACWFILAAMIFDFLDGFMARLLKAYSDMGKELDSLADVVSFGIAPALILYSLINDGALTGPSETVPFIKKIIAFIPVIMPAFAGLRLAKFNTDPTQAIDFRGLPTPANALAVISVVIAARYSDLVFVKSFVETPLALAVYSLILSFLMVTRFRLLSLKLTSAAVKGNEGRYLMVLLLAVAFLILGIGAAPLIIPIYLVASAISSFFPAASSPD